MTRRKSVIEALSSISISKLFDGILIFKTIIFSTHKMQSKLTKIDNKREMTTQSAESDLDWKPFSYID